MDKWMPIETAPKDGSPLDRVDVWMEVPPAFGCFGDSFRVIDAWQKDGKWFHYHNGQQKQLNHEYITHWARISTPVPDTSAVRAPAKSEPQR